MQRGDTPFLYFYLRSSERYSDNLVNLVRIPCQLLAARTGNGVETAEKKRQALDFAFGFLLFASEYSLLIALQSRNIAIPMYFKMNTTDSTRI